ncbi:hypothetical protein D6D01_08644 [Aureobasidium pullulans]|uniref:Uncharacterized protein n=1 Tax=Aureobasidium pullulans TaxID=5580 RepID=A0A4S9K981_AURPU|nr:hypothetical protein D6D01_08644 [Aureobasidium pullulans]
MSSLPVDFLSTPIEGTIVKRIDFAKGLSPEYAELHAYIIDDTLTPSECSALLTAAEAAADWQRAMIQVGHGRQRQEDDQRKCRRLIWDSAEVARRLWDRVKMFIPEIATLDKQSELTGGGAAMKGEIWEASRLNERLRFLRYEHGE